MTGKPFVFTADVVEQLKTFSAGKFDACLCDPPYGLKFMGKGWDHGVPSSGVWAEVLRVLRPGGFLMAFGGTRTYHRLSVAIEDAGFEIRDCLMWLYGSGFPKSLDISKAIDKAAGHFDKRGAGEIRDRNALDYGGSTGKAKHGLSSEYGENPPPTTPEAAVWQGYGTALKPAWEPVILAMKPCEGTFAANALEHGVAGLNIDGGRIRTDDPLGGGAELEVQAAKPEGWDRPWRSSAAAQAAHAERIRENVQRAELLGRWPANLLLSHTPFCADGECHPLCAVRLLDEQGGLGDRGGPSRFFYCAKVSKSERNMGGIDNRHPTLKPIKLTEYLATLLLPPVRPEGEPPRRLLVPYSGAGSEMIGALAAGWDEVFGIDNDPQSVEWAEKRLSAWKELKGGLG